MSAAPKPSDVHRPWQVRAAALAEWTMGTLVNRTDAWGGYLPLSRRRERPKADGGTFVEKVETRPAKSARGRVLLTAGVITRHFAAEDVGDLIGLHTTSTENISRWFGIDVDKHGDEDGAHPESNLKAALFWHEKLVSMGFNVLLTDSNGRGGFHLLVPLDAPTPTAKVFAFVKALVGDWEEHGLKAAPEVFPKQPSLPAGKYGNWLRLPGRHHTHDHWSAVWDGEGSWLRGEAAVAAILKTVPSSAGLVPDAPPPEQRTAKPKPVVAPSSTPRGRLTDRDIALQCLDALDAGTHYDRWLQIGMALHSTDAGAEMLAAWDRWSAGAADRYEAGKCEKKWQTFNAGGGRGIGSLVKWAREAGARIRFREVTGRSPSQTAARGNGEAAGGDSAEDESEAAAAIRDAMVDAQVAGSAAPIYDAAHHFANLDARSTAKIRAELKAWKRATGIDLDLTDLRAVRREAIRDNRAENPMIQSAEDPAASYLETPSGLIWRKPTRDGYTDVLLSNFTARVTREIVRDDGAERELIFELVIKRGSQDRRVSVPATKFAAMEWVFELGPTFIIHAGPGVRDHLRAAIQCHSNGVTKETIFAHIGWREIDGRDVYLHAGGGIGAEGNRGDIRVDATEALARYALPDPPDGAADGRGPAFDRARRVVALPELTVPHPDAHRLSEPA
jgi:hypothetical protein